MSSRHRNFPGIDTSNVIASSSSGYYTATQDCGACGQLYSDSAGFVNFNGINIAVFNSGNNNGKCFQIPMKKGDYIGGDGGWAWRILCVFGVRKV